MSEHVQDVTERAKLIGCLVIWSLFLVFALVTILLRPANRTILAVTAVSILITSAAWDFIFAGGTTVHSLLESDPSCEPSDVTVAAARLKAVTVGSGPWGCV